jgi:hypothetical protein
MGRLSRTRYVQSQRNAGSPKGREPYGDGVLVVVRARESNDSALQQLLGGVTKTPYNSCVCSSFGSSRLQGGGDLAGVKGGSVPYFQPTFLKNDNCQRRLRKK